MGIRYSAVTTHTTELAEVLRDELSAQWRDIRGIEIERIGVSSIKASEEDEQMIKELQRNAAFMDPSRAQAHLVGARAAAMQTAAGNAGGAAIGFMGMNMAANAGSGFDQGIAMQAMQQQAMQQQAMQQQAAAPAGWTCSCGQSGNTGKFCQGCGKPQPQPQPAAGSWPCKCGATVTGKFCPECGTKRPEEAASWTCACGSVNTGKFCPECGAKKPEAAPSRCEKCGWEPPKGAKIPKFCPECGDPF